MFKPFTQLVPRGLVKTFTHGYAQSVVAASQSSFASTVNPLGGHRDHNSIRQPLVPFKGQQPIIPQGSAGNKSSASQNPDSLSAAFVIWQARQKSKHLRRQSQQTQNATEFSSRQAVEAGSSQGITDQPSVLSPVSASPELPRVQKTSRAYSTSAVDGIQFLEDGLLSDTRGHEQVPAFAASQPPTASIDSYSWLDLASATRTASAKGESAANATVRDDQQRFLEHVALLEPLCSFWHSRSPAPPQERVRDVQSLVQVLFRDGFLLRPTEGPSASSQLLDSISLRLPLHQQHFLADVAAHWVLCGLQILPAEMTELRKLLHSTLAGDTLPSGNLRQLIVAAQTALDQIGSPDTVGRPAASSVAETTGSNASSLLSVWGSQQSRASSLTSVDSSAASGVNLRPHSHAPGQQDVSSKVHELLDTGLIESSLPSLRQAVQLLPSVPSPVPTANVMLFKKAINLAASLKRLDIATQIYALARRVIPPDTQIRPIWLAWNTILDAMVVASLNAGDQLAAQHHHHRLNQMLSSPSANTHGLYITSLTKKDHISDEASFALDVFDRAIAEGVTPTAFLYNAVVAKLAKARRIEDCRRFLLQMETRGIHPTSITYGTIISAFARVANEAEALKYFERMEQAPDYRALPAPFNQMMQFYVQSPQHQNKVKALSFYASMKRQGVAPTLHTYNLLIQAHASLEPRDIDAAKGVLAEMKAVGLQPESQHHASLITELGRAQHDLPAAREAFNDAMADPKFAPDSVLYQALLEALGHNGDMTGTEALLADMQTRRVPLTGYITNALITGHTRCGDLQQARAAFYRLTPSERKPSTYEAMIKACRVVDPMEARSVLDQMRKHRPSFPFKVVRSAEQLVR